jgi:hypothetical protein
MRGAPAPVRSKLRCAFHSTHDMPSQFIVVSSNVHCIQPRRLIKNGYSRTYTALLRLQPQSF